VLIYFRTGWAISFGEDVFKGAVLAWSAAWAFGVVSRGQFLKSQEWCLWLGRIVALGFILYFVGFQWSRAGSSFSDLATVDRSVGNRVELWGGGLKMIAASPWRGWGAGESGRAYLNWFQDLERAERFTTMVNSYLSVAVEYGLPTFSLTLFILCLPVVYTWHFARSGNGVSLAAGAVLISLVSGEWV